MEISGNLEVNGKLLSGKEILFKGGNSKTLSGVGTIAIEEKDKKLEIENNTSILSGSLLNILCEIEIGDNTTITNNGTVNLAENIEGKSNSSK